MSSHIGIYCNELAHCHAKKSISFTDALQINIIFFTDLNNSFTHSFLVYGEKND